MADDEFLADIARYRYADMAAKVRASAVIEIIMGIGFAVLGLGLTWAISALFSRTGFGVVFYGLVIVGGYKILRGLFYFVFPGQLIRS